MKTLIIIFSIFFSFTTSASTKGKIKNGTRVAQSEDKPQDPQDIWGETPTEYTGNNLPEQKALPSKNGGNEESLSTTNENEAIESTGDAKPAAQPETQKSVEFDTEPKTAPAEAAAETQPEIQKSEPSKTAKKDPDAHRVRNFRKIASIGYERPIVVQFGVFFNKKFADNLAEKLSKKEVAVDVQEKTSRNGKTYYQVRAKDTYMSSKAIGLRDSLIADGLPKPILIRANKAQ